MKTFALITGASQGYGKALAIEFAKNDINVVLVALPNSGVIKLAEYLQNCYGIKAIDYECDLTLPNSCNDLKYYLNSKGIIIKYLVNNAGVLSKDLFENLSEDYLEKQIILNVLVPTKLCKLFLTDLIKTKNGGILNVSSLASFFHLPKKQVYGGTKSYLLSFSKTLGMELKKYNIKVSTVCPGGMNTTTKICLQNRKLGILGKLSILNPEEAAEITIKNFIKAKRVIIPGKLNKAFLVLNSLIPEALKNFLIGFNMGKAVVT